MRARRGTGCSAQHILVAHELAIVFAQRARLRLIARIRSVGGLGPLPQIAKHLFQRTWKAIRGARMEPATLGELTCDGRVGGCDLPFRLSGQPRASPARVSIRLEVTQMTNRFVPADGTHAGQSHHPPISLTLLPIKWRIPATLIHRSPAQGKPQLGPLISSILDEGQKLLVSDLLGGQRKRSQEDLMARPFVIETDLQTLKSDGIKPSIKLEPSGN